MMRMQVQLPDELYNRLRTVAAEREWSLAEAIRRATELLVGVHPESVKAWELPQVDLGETLLPEEKWAEVLEQDMLERHLK